MEIGVKYKAEIFELTSLYMEAKDALEDAQDSWDSTYFDEDFQDARDAVRELGDCYEGLRGMCSEQEIPELEKVVAAWDGLPDLIKAQILELVKIST